MKALITGASDGIGKEMAYILSNMGYDIIIVARNLEKMEASFSNIKNCKIISMDLSIEENCFSLYEQLKNENIDILINNAGFGILGSFLDTDLIAELNMINLNINAVHILTKLFLKDMVAKNNGYILNVSSIGGFLAGPFISTYYSTKAYVLNLTLAINQELKINKSNVYIGAFCPATINTNFHKTAGAKGYNKGINGQKAAQYAIKKMFQKKSIIIPSYGKFLPFFISITPKNIMCRITAYMQNKKHTI